MTDRYRLSRRQVGLMALLLVALVGVGLGTLVTGPDGPVQPPVVEVTPTTPTPTPPPDDPTPPPDGQTPTPPDDGTPVPPPSSPTPPSTTAPPPAGDGGGGGGAGGSGSGDGSDSSVTLQAVGSTTILQYSDLKPTDAGRDSIVLENAGSSTARLDVTDIAVGDEENGIVPAETSIDAPANGGELSEHVMVVIEVNYPDGSTGYFYDTGTGARSLADLGAETGPSEGSELAPGERATVTFDWHLPGSTGNVVQSDRTEFTVDFRLRTT